MRIVITINEDQKALLSRASATAGLPLSLWIRATSLSAARGLGVPDPERARQKAAHAAAVAARRDRRKALRAAKVAEDLAWSELARCQGAEREAIRSGAGYEEARAARIAADSAAVAARDAREVLEA